MDTFNQLHKEINVIIADEHPAFCRGLKEIVRCIPGMKKIDIATNGNKALELLSMNNYDLALLDIRMPNMSSIKAAHYTRKKFPDTHIFFLTPTDDYYSVRETFEDGYQGYLLKTADESEILVAIDTVLAGERYFSTEGMQNILPPENDDSINKKIVPIDKKIIELIYKEKSNKDIADEFHLPLRSVENRRHALYHKLGVNSTVGLIRYAIHTGIIEP